MIKVIPYDSRYQPWFEKFNRDWIEKNFWMEQMDFDILQNPDDHVILPGGAIFMATWNDEPAGTVAVKFYSQRIFELSKMAVDEKFRGLGIAQKLAETAIGWASEKGAEKVILYSSTKLPPAISLYRKLGFYEVPVDGPYKRSDIKMELQLRKEQL